MPLPGEFLSGAHRGRFNPKDGQLYVSGMAGWGTYTPADGCFQRVRYTGEPGPAPGRLPRPRERRLVTFTRPLDRDVADQRKTPFRPGLELPIQRGYGSPELSPRHPGQPGHDALAIRSAHVLADGRTLFLEIPDLQPVNQLHLHLRADAGRRSTCSPPSTSWRRRSRASRATGRLQRRSPPTRSSPTWSL